MKSSAKPEVQLVVDACMEAGVQEIVLSPGSRNAPLAIAFDEHPGIKTFVVADERSAAFYALGMAMQLERPVAIACTSGSASLNYFPAVAEAYYQQIPLIVLTADRPEEWIDQGDGQTIVQQNVFGTHVLAAAQMHVIHSDSQRWLFERRCAEVLQRANGRRKGPVHLNIPLGEPLYEVTESPDKIHRWTELAEGNITLTNREVNRLGELWRSSSRRMVLCGQTAGDPRLEKTLSELVENPSVAILTEHTSNLRNRRFVQCIDRSLNQIAEEQVAGYQPDLLIVIGGAIVSKRIKSFLRSSNVKTIRIGNDFPFMDTYQSAVFTTQAHPADVLETLMREGEERAPSVFGSKWKQLDHQSETAHEKYLAACSFSDLKAMEIMLDVVPENAQLHLGNSSIIRYALLFNPVPSIRYRCNRGTSGIDGSSSTACGAALADPQNWHVLISGDMSFFYDSNAFWSQHLPANLRVFVLNNGGGDIFNIIPGPDTTTQKDKYFVTRHQFSAEYICKTFGIGYFSASSAQEIEEQMSDFFTYEENGSPKLMEINTGMLENSAVLKKYFVEGRVLK